MFELKPDYELSKQRMDLFWEHEVVDRPVVQFVLLKPPEEQVPLPASHHATSAERWLDAQYQLDYARAHLANQYFLGDSLPVVWPNLGPEVFAACYGCPLHFGDYGTCWTEPVLDDWRDAGRLHFDRQNPYLLKLEEMTRAFIEAGQGKFMTGMTDWHPGGDCLVAMRGSLAFALDLLEHPAEVKCLLAQVEADYFQVYDHFYTMLREAGLPVATWTPLAVDGRFYLPSNDFSIVISSEMFAEFFLPGIIRECQFLDRSLYHLDGPGALRHLEMILSIKELDAVQFVPTTGDEAFSKWAHVYRRIQAAGKGVQVTCTIDEVDEVMQVIRPEGLFLVVNGVPSRDAAEAMLARLTKWTAECKD